MQAIIKILFLISFILTFCIIKNKKNDKTLELIKSDKNKKSILKVANV